MYMTSRSVHVWPEFFNTNPIIVPPTTPMIVRMVRRFSPIKPFDFGAGRELVCA